jgi:hypothetical protein
MSTSSVFYHFIDARRRLDHGNDFSAWLVNFDDCAEVCDRLDAIDPFFGSLVQTRDEIAAVMQGDSGVTS